jgi:hypothetical protein
MAMPNSERVSVLPGNGNGGFGARKDFATGNTPRSVTTADFNGDGRSDLITANSYGNTVSVLLGDGSGGLGPSTDFATGSGVYAVTTADFNGDGRIDAATANSLSNTVSMLFNLYPGDATSDGKVNFADYLRLEANFGKIGQNWGHGDFNGDGKVSFADYLLLEASFGKSITPPAPAPAPVPAALAMPTVSTAVRTASPDAVQSLQARTMALLGWDAKAPRAAKAARLGRQLVSSFGVDLLALNRTS